MSPACHSFCRYLNLLVAALVVIVPAALAVSMQGIYEAEVPLEAETDAARQQAFAEAMAAVLVRVTGRPDTATAPELAPLRTEAAGYVQQFRGTVDGRLWVRFDEVALNRALARLGLPIWGSERPSVLLVLAVEQPGGERYILSAEDEIPDPGRDALRESQLALAEARGLPLVLPLMDAQDRSVMSFNEVWGGFDAAAETAAERYDVDAVLIGRYAPSVPYRTRWTLVAGDETARWTGELESGVPGVADRFVARYAAATGEAAQGEVSLAVTGIGGMADYGTVLRHLEHLTAVNRVSVLRLDGDRVVFGLRLKGSVNNLDQAIRLAGLLRPVAPTETPGPRPAQLSYRFGR